MYCVKWSCHHPPSTVIGNGFPSTQKPAATFHDNSQDYDSFKGLALIRDILLRACGRVFRHTTIVMDFISDKSFNKVVQSASREIIIVLTTD